MLNIGLDVDDTLKPWSERAHNAIVAAGLDNGRGEPLQWDMAEHYGIPARVFWEVVFSAYDDGMLMLPPYEGVVPGILNLMEAGYQVHIVTARGCSEGWRAPLIREETRNWLSYYEIPHDTLTFTQDKHSLGMDYFLDDRIATVESLRAAGCEAYLRDQPHNRTATHLPRVADLTEFISVVRAEQELAVQV